MVEYCVVFPLQSRYQGPAHAGLPHGPLEPGRTQIGNQQDEWYQPEKMQKYWGYAFHNPANLSQSAPHEKHLLPARKLPDWPDQSQAIVAAKSVSAWLC